MSTTTFGGSMDSLSPFVLVVFVGFVYIMTFGPRFKNLILRASVKLQDPLLYVGSVLIFSGWERYVCRLQNPEMNLLFVGSGLAMVALDVVFIVLGKFSSEK